MAQGEWVETFNSYTTEVPEDAPRLPGELTLGFPGRRQSRTAVQGTVSVPRQAAGTAELADYRSYNFILIGEVVADGELFDNFRYKFDLPVTEVGDAEKLPLVFQRFLRPGDYTLMVKVEDLNGGAFFRSEQPLSVPRVEQGMPPPPMNEATAQLLAEANAALARGDTTLQLIQPQGELQTGYVRFDTLTTGDDIAKVVFALDGQELLTKAKPPWSVDLDLGSVPQPRTLTAVAFDAAGAEVASDELVLNAAGHRFRVGLVEPRKGKTYRHSLTAEARVQVPEEQTVDRVEFFLNETRVATLYQEPWVQPIVLPEEAPIAYVRAVAYLPDGNSTEDLVFVNAPDYLEEIDVQFVELYTSFVDRQGQQVEAAWNESDVRVLEDGAEQQVVRFEQVRDLPIHAGILIDVSASMEDKLEQAQHAAVRFLEQTIEPKDRASVMTFNDHPNLAVRFTNDVTELAGGLAGLKAERGTALYDSVIFSLYYFNGIKGQRALLILSDGKDESSRFTWEQALEYARRAGVTIYTMALRDDAAHKKLTKLAEATGGRSHLVQDPAELAAIYDTIQRELRSKYLIAYQSSNTTESKDFRAVEVKVGRPGVEAQTMKGYYP
jgi:Ca-activated chloride channel family protein